MSHDKLLKRLQVGHDSQCSMSYGMHEHCCDCSFPDRAEAVVVIEQLQADLAAARADAERYRWIRDNHEVRGRAMEIVYGMNGCDWDAAIDAELARRS